MVEINVKYFEKPGDHTGPVLEAATAAAEKFGIKTVVVASTRGATARAALEAFDPGAYNLVVVTHSYGFAKPGECEFPDDLRSELVEKGVRVVTGGHALSGVDSALLKKMDHWSGTAIFQRALRWMVCDGFKVCLEIVAMAVDAGAVLDPGADVLAIGGTGKGADTACVVKPAGTRNFFDMRVKMLLAKPQ
ncbi:MAG: pyruvate kinase alpha/beta domain-containing protein [Promethearchaeota archaeon]